MSQFQILCGWHPRLFWYPICHYQAAHTLWNCTAARLCTSMGYSNPFWDNCGQKTFFFRTTTKTGLYCFVWFIFSYLILAYDFIIRNVTNYETFGNWKEKKLGTATYSHQGFIMCLPVLPSIPRSFWIVYLRTQVQVDRNISKPCQPRCLKNWTRKSENKCVWNHDLQKLRHRFEVASWQTFLERSTSLRPGSDKNHRGQIEHTTYHNEIVSFWLQKKNSSIKPFWVEAKKIHECLNQNHQTCLFLQSPVGFRAPTALVLAPGLKQMFVRMTSWSVTTASCFGREKLSCFQRRTTTFWEEKRRIWLQGFM